MMSLGLATSVRGWVLSIGVLLHLTGRAFLDPADNGCAQLFVTAHSASLSMSSMPSGRPARFDSALGPR